jgi:hypothetical protein
MDASNVYGSDNISATRLRAFKDGKLKTDVSTQRFLPQGPKVIPSTNDLLRNATKNISN